MGERATPRLMIYSHDSYGLGHLRRCLKIAKRLSHSSQAPNVLIVTGSPRARSFEPPPGCDTLKLPAITKTTEGRYQPRTLGTSLTDVVALRAELLCAAARSFKPDVVLVDHIATGLEGELLPLIDDVRSRRGPKLVLGLRDVIDDVERVRREWQRLGVWPLIDEVYDRVLVYGDEILPTTAQELGLVERLGRRISFVGYLGEPLSASIGAPRSEPTIVVTAGGGGDGQGVLRAYCEYLEGLTAPAPFKSVVLTGPLLSRRRAVELGHRFSALDHPVELLDFTDDLERRLRGATGVISMAGYNSVVELLTAAKPGLLVPRTHPRREQIIRAERMARVTQLQCCPPGDGTVQGISTFVSSALAGAGSPAPGVRLDGLDRTAAVIGELTGSDHTAKTYGTEMCDAVAS